MLTAIGFAVLYSLLLVTKEGCGDYEYACKLLGTNHSSLNAVSISLRLCESVFPIPYESRSESFAFGYRQTAFHLEPNMCRCPSLVKAGCGSEPTNERQPRDASALPQQSST